MKKKELSELQVKFLNALFGEAQGKPAEAKRLAGYSENTPVADIIRGLKEEIIEAAQLILATHSTQAALELVGVMVDPNQAGSTIKLKAIQEVLNRAGVSAPNKETDVNLKVPQGGLFIMPAKGSLDHKEINNEEGKTDSNETDPTGSFGEDE